jgi:DNA-binding NarL/FixJ family response regulator
MRSQPVRPELVRVAIVDDHEAVRAGLERFLRGRPWIELVASHADDRGLLALMDRRRVDVAVLDYDLGASDGLDLTLRIKQRFSPPAVAIYSGYAGAGIAVAAAAAGADAIVNKAEPVSRLIETIERLAAGERRLAEPSRDMRELACSRLHDEDLAVMSLLLERVRAADIAAVLGLDEQEALCRARRVVAMLQATASRPDGVQHPYRAAAATGTVE